jgi:Flp pilus assembly protein TadB
MSRNAATTTALALLARLYPWPVDAGVELRRALAYLDVDATPETVGRAGYGAGLLAAVVVAGLALTVGVPPSATTTLALAAGLGAVHAVHAAPQSLATMRRTDALGEAPTLVGRAVLRMRISPAVERAAGFAGDRGDGPLAASLDEHVRRARGTPDSGLGRFAAEWADWFPALRRAALLVESAGDAGPGERARTLDRAMDAVLDGTRDRMAAFADDVQGPATAVYAFGVLLPLALVSVLPAARATGLPATLPAVVVGYDLLLPTGLLWATWWLLARRPVAFPPTRVPRDHPDVRDARWPAIVLSCGAAATGWMGGSLLAAWAGPLLAAGWGVGAALVWWFRPVKQVRDRARAVEGGLPDALYLIGRRVAGGTAVERAVSAAADEVADPTGAVLADAARRNRQLRVGLGDAFLGDHGPLATLPSTRAQTAAETLALAAREGRPAGAAAVAMADLLEELAAVEAEARRSLARVTETLASTAVLFAPLVGGVTVAMAAGIESVDGAVAAVPTAGLGLAIGVYVLLLSVLLTALSTGLDRGLDGALVGYRCGRALLVAPTVFLVAFRLAGAAV